MGNCCAANKLKEKLRNGQNVYGTFAFAGEPAFVEIMGRAGLDFVLIDTEHTPNPVERVEHLIRAAEASGITPLVRVNNNHHTPILTALDAGARGIVVPSVNTAEQAQAVVRSARYAPQGERGLAGIVRAAHYGFTPLADYVERANEETLIMVQVEHVEAVRNLDEILAVDGIDAIFIGPMDLSQSMGLTGQLEHPEFRRTIHDIITRGRAAGKEVAIFCVSAEDAAYWRNAGATILTIGAEVTLFASAVKDLMTKLEV